MAFADFWKTSSNQDSNIPNNPAAPQPAAKPLSTPNPAVDAQGKIPGSETSVNPMDAYNKMYDDANKSSDIQAPSFKLDSAVLDSVSSSMDFTKGVDPALMERALSGDTKALLEVMQSTGRSAYRASLEHNTALTEKHLSQRADYETSRVNTGVRQQLTSDALSSTPNYSHPVVKQELNRVANQYARANPDASPKQVAEAAQKYITDLSSALVPNSSKSNSDAGEEMDWSKYLTS